MVRKLQTSSSSRFWVAATYGIGRALWVRRIGLLSELFVITTPRSRFTTPLGGVLVAYCLFAFFAISFGTGLVPSKIAFRLEARSFTSNLTTTAGFREVRRWGLPHHGPLALYERV